MTNTHFTIPCRVDGRDDLGVALRVCTVQPQTSLCIAVAVAINNCPQYDSIIGHRVPQSGMLQLDHCALQFNVCGMCLKVQLLIGGDHCALQSNVCGMCLKVQLLIGGS